MRVCVGCVNLCLGNWLLNTRVFSLRSTTLVVLVMGLLVAIPPGRPEAWGLLLPLRIYAEELFLPRLCGDLQTSETMPPLPLISVQPVPPGVMRT